MTSSWEIVYTTEFRQWLETLSDRHSRTLSLRLELLQVEGPSLGRPHVDHIKGSKYSNLKELRINSDVAIRVFFLFDTHRRAVMLIGGQKSNSGDWYRSMIKRAESIMDAHSRKEKPE